MAASGFAKRSELGKFVPRTEVTSDEYTLVAADSGGVVAVNFAEAVTINLPADQAVAGRPFQIKDESGKASEHSIGLVPGGGKTINGQPKDSITRDYGSARIYSDGSNYFRR